MESGTRSWGKKLVNPLMGDLIGDGWFCMVSHVVNACHYHILFRSKKWHARIGQRVAAWDATLSKNSLWPESASSINDSLLNQTFYLWRTQSKQNIVHILQWTHGTVKHYLCSILSLFGATRGWLCNLIPRVSRFRLVSVSRETWRLKSHSMATLISNVYLLSQTSFILII